MKRNVDKFEFAKRLCHGVCVTQISGVFVRYLIILWALITSFSIALFYRIIFSDLLEKFLLNLFHRTPLFMGLYTLTLFPKSICAVDKLCSSTMHSKAAFASLFTLFNL